VPASSGAQDGAADPERVATERRAPGAVRMHPGARRRRGLVALGLVAALAVALVVWLLAPGGGGASPVSVPRVVGSSAAAARDTLAHAGLRYRATLVAAPGATPGSVTRQTPRAGASARRGSTIGLAVAEQPRWRTLTTFAALNSGGSVPFRIEGRRWRVRYAMSYEGSCTLLVVCFGPSAHVSNLKTGASLEGFDLSSGSGHGHTFESGPGLYSVSVLRGDDSARWSMTVQDYY
jgi:hypothetical protein